MFFEGNTTIAEPDDGEVLPLALIEDSATAGELPPIVDFSTGEEEPIDSGGSLPETEVLSQADNAREQQFFGVTRYVLGGSLEQPDFLFADGLGEGTSFREAIHPDYLDRLDQIARTLAERQRNPDVSLPEDLRLEVESGGRVYVSEFTLTGDGEVVSFDSSYDLPKEENLLSPTDEFFDNTNVSAVSQSEDPEGTEPNIDELAELSPGYAWSAISTEYRPLQAEAPVLLPNDKEQIGIESSSSRIFQEKNILKARSNVEEQVVQTDGSYYPIPRDTGAQSIIEYTPANKSDGRNSLDQEIDFISQGTDKEGIFYLATQLDVETAPQEQSPEIEYSAVDRLVVEPENSPAVNQFEKIDVPFGRETIISPAETDVAPAPLETSLDEVSESADRQLVNDRLHQAGNRELIDTYRDSEINTGGLVEIQRSLEDQSSRPTGVNEIPQEPIVLTEIASHPSRKYEVTTRSNEPLPNIRPETPNPPIDQSPSADNGERLASEELGQQLDDQLLPPRDAIQAERDRRSNRESDQSVPSATMESVNTYPVTEINNSQEIKESIPIGIFQHEHSPDGQSTASEQALQGESRQSTDFLKDVADSEESATVKLTQEFANDFHDLFGGPIVDIYSTLHSSPDTVESEQRVQFGRSIKDDPIVRRGRPVHGYRSSHRQPHQFQATA